MNCQLEKIFYNKKLKFLRKVRKVAKKEIMRRLFKESEIKDIDIFSVSEQVMNLVWMHDNITSE